MAEKDYSGIIERRNSLTSHEEDIFLRVFEELVSDLQADPKFADIPDLAEWLKRILCYNVPDGKQLRGRCVVSAYRMLVDYDPTDEGLHLASILGWTVEIFQACYLIADDIMDGSEVRRGKPCWHLVENIGKSAINDAFILYAFIFRTMAKYFISKPYYNHLIRLFNEMFLKRLWANVQTRETVMRSTPTFP